VLPPQKPLAKKIIEESAAGREILHGSDRRGVEMPQEEGLFLERRFSFVLARQKTC